MSFAPGDHCPEKVNDNPAAGAFSREQVNIQRGPQYSSTERGMPEKANDSPGPADYHPEKILNLEHKPYVSYGNRKYVHKPTDVPGDGGD